MSRFVSPGGSEGKGAFAAEQTDIGPGSTVAGLDEEELIVLRQMGDHWGRVLGPRGAWLRALPIHPGLHRFRSR